MLPMHSLDTQNPSLPSLASQLGRQGNAGAAKPWWASQCAGRCLARPLPTSCFDPTIYLQEHSSGAPLCSVAGGEALQGALPHHLPMQVHHQPARQGLITVAKNAAKS